jgi:hypothetical protein
MNKVFVKYSQVIMNYEYILHKTKVKKLVLPKMVSSLKRFSLRVLMEESKKKSKVIDLTSKCQSGAIEHVPEPKLYE